MPVRAAQDAPTVRRYHETTKHLPGRPSATPYGLEWRNEPSLFKDHPGIEAERPPKELERLLRLGAGLHPRRGDPHYRTFMSAGALHPVELYAATALGLWHYHPGERSVRRLRSDDPRSALARAAGAPEVSRAGFALILTGILWRTAWKYGARGWRHIFWDAGAMLANLLALADEAGPRLLTAFVDAEVAAVVGVEPPREAPLALLVAGSGPDAAGPARLEPLDLESPPLSSREHSFPEAEEAQAASSFAAVEQVHAWRNEAERFPSPPAAGKPPEALAEAILRRGSARAFTRDPVDRGQLAELLAWASRPVAGDLPPLCSALVVVHAVEGLATGVHRFKPPDRLELVRQGADRRVTAHLCLDQPHGGQAAATIFFTTDLDRTLSTFGDRAYRAAQLDAGIRAGRASLGAYARGLAATGLTFYDDEVRRFLGTEEEPMMCLAVGVDARRR